MRLASRMKPGSKRSSDFILRVLGVMEPDF